MRRILFLFVCFLPLAAAAGWAQPSGKDTEKKSYWVLDHTETKKNENNPYFTVSGSSVQYTRTHTGHKSIREPGGYLHSERATDKVNATGSWTTPPSRIPFGEEDKVQINYSFSSSPHYDDANGDVGIQLSLMGIPHPWDIFVRMSTTKGVARSQTVFEPSWDLGHVSVNPCAVTHQAGTFKAQANSTETQMQYYLPDGGFWGVIRPTGGMLVAPNRSYAKVTVKVEWHGQEFKQELRVPVNSQPYRDVEIPPGSDVIRAYDKYDREDDRRMDQLVEIRRKIVMDHRFAELRPLFYKVAVMIEGHDKVFGFDDRDYENIMTIFKRYCSGEIGTYFAVRQTVSPDDEDFDAIVATIAAMDRSIPVIICRIGLGIVTGGASEFVLTPVSALAEMKEYVDQGGDSAWGGFAQVSVKIIAMELLFAGVGKGFSKIKQWRADRAAKLDKLALQTKKIGESTGKALEKTRINTALGQRPPFSSGPQADKIRNVARKVKETIKNAKDMADDAAREVKQLTDKAAKSTTEMANEAICNTRQNASLYTGKSILREESAKLDYTQLMAKIRVLEGLGNPPPQGVLPLTLEEARLVLQDQFGSTLESVVEECGRAVLDVNAVL